MEELAGLRIVKAKYSFKGKNNDELCFKKGDYIVITQPLDSDWWEGTLEGMTGWFPTSYVQEMRYDQLPEDQKLKFAASRSGAKTGNSGSSARSYHTEVLASVIETEAAFVSELELAWNNLIQPISGANILSKDEFFLVSSNYEEVLALHRQFLSSLKECAKQALNVRRVGRVFLEHAPAFRAVYERYASNHPRSVRILHSQKRGALSGFAKGNDLGRFIAERTGNGNPPGTSPAEVQMLLPLTTALALPLCRLEKLPLTLRELERHLDEGHFDRGDTQRALALFKQLIADCQEFRLLRELELDLANASVAGLPTTLEAAGPEPHKLAHGVSFLSPVKLATGTDVVDRLFVLYPTRLVILSAEPDLTKLAFEADFLLSHLRVDRTLPSPDAAKRFLHSFSLYFRPAVPLASPEESSSEIKTSSTDCFVVICSSASLSNRWIELLTAACESIIPSKPSPRQYLSVDDATKQPQQQQQQQQQQQRRSVSSNILQNPAFPHTSFSDNSIADRQSVGKGSVSTRVPPALLSMMSPLACVVGNLPLVPPTLSTGMQSSSTLAALAPASPHPNRKPNVLTTASSASTPLARKRFAITNANFGGGAVHGQLISSPDSNLLTAEDQQLMSIVESFVSVPQTVPIGAAQFNMSPVHRDGDVAGGAGLVPLSQVQAAVRENGGVHGALTIEPIISVQQRVTSGHHGPGSRNSNSRHDLLIAEEEKLLLEELKPLNESQNGTGGGLHERTLVDAVYALWDYVAELRGEVARLRQTEVSNGDHVKSAVFQQQR